jgi:hypothetical protein
MATSSIVERLDVIEQVGLRFDPRTIAGAKVTRGGTPTVSVWSEVSARSILAP